MATAKAAVKPVQEEALDEVFRAETGGAVFVLRADRERMRLFLQCDLKTEGVPFPASRMSLLGILPKNIPAKLIHPDVLDDIADRLGRGESIAERRIAKGYPPAPGRDGKLVYLVKVYSKNMENREIVDPWFVKTFDNVEMGTAVARLYAPQNGTPGLSVLGEVIPGEPGKPASVENDETLRHDVGPTYISLVAQLSGYLRVDRKQLGIVHDLVISGDVDHQSGDIQFVGKVTVRGDVKKNFRVEARDSITVQGNVQDGVLVSQMGDVTVKGHVTGESLKTMSQAERLPLQQRLRMAERRRAQITCAGIFRASLLDSVSVEAGADIEVEKEIRSCSLRTRGVLRAPKAQLIGGETYAVCGVEAAILGTDLETTTDIILCSDRESSPEHRVLNEKMKAHETAEEMIRLYLGPYAENPEAIKRLGTDHRRKMTDLQTKLTEVLKGKQKLAEEQERLLSDAQYNTVSRVNFNKLAHAGVRVIDGEDTFTVQENLTGPKTIEYFPAERRFAVIDQQPIQCVLEKRQKK